MGNKTVVDTIIGKHHKYEIMKKESTPLEPIKYYLYRDGRPYQGPFLSRRDAAEAASKEG